MNEPQTSPKIQMSARIRRILLVGVGLFVIALIGILVVLPGEVERRLVRLVEEQIGVAPEIEAVQIDVIRFRVTIEGFALQLPDEAEAILTFDELIVDLRPFGFLRADVALDELVVLGPRLLMEVDESGEFNFARLLVQSSAKQTPDATSATDSNEVEADLKVDIGKIRIEGGNLVFRDRSKSPLFQTEVHSLDLSVSDVNTRGGDSSPLELSLRLDDASRLDWKGSLGLQPFRSEGHVKLHDFDLRLAADFLSSRLAFEAGGGAVDFSADYRVHFERGAAKNSDPVLSLAIHDAAVALRDLRVIDPEDGSDAISIENLTIHGIDARASGADLEEIVIKEVELATGRIETQRTPDGAIRLIDLFSLTGGEADAGLAVPENSPVSVTSNVDDATEVRNETDDPLRLRIDHIQLRDLEIDMLDQTQSTPVALRLSDLQVEAGGFDSSSKSPFALMVEAEVNDKGHVEISGPVVLDPLDANLDLRAEGIALTDFQSYLESVGRFELADGALSAEMNIRLANSQDSSETHGSGTPPNGTPRLHVGGRLQIDDLVAVEQSGSKRFLEWKTLRVEDLDYSPAGLRIKEIAISEAIGSIVLQESGQSNLASIFASEGDAGGTARFSF